MKRFLAIAAVILLAVPQVLLSQDKDGDLDAKYAAELLPAGTRAPEFEILDMNGKTVRLSDFRGSYVVLDFWATWCPDCRADVPALKETVKKYGSKKIRFISISSDTDREKWVSYVKENKMKWTHVSELVPRKESKVSADYRVRWIPSVYVIDPEGKVLLGTVVLRKVDDLLAGISGRGA